MWIERVGIDKEAAFCIYSWRSDPDTLAASLHQTMPSFDKFFALFRAHYFQKMAPFFLRTDQERVAFVRFRPYESIDVAEISIVVNPKRRKSGFGLQALEAARKIAEEQNMCKLVAFILPENTASKALFEKAGYKFLSEQRRTVHSLEGDASILVYVYELELRPKKPVFFIAEIGSNWFTGDKSLERAFELIDVASSAGADAVKFQTFRVKDLYAPGAGAPSYLKEDIHEVLSQLEMAYDVIPKLAERAKNKGIEFMSTPFSLEDFAAVDPYVRRHKIASYEIVHLPLLQAMARTGKPVFLSTGASYIEEIAWSVRQLQRAGCSDITTLQCTAAYPAQPTAMNVVAIQTLKASFGLPVGLSDHSLDTIVAPVLAVAFGAAVIEKHITLSRNLLGPDHSFALEPEELCECVQKVRLAEEMVGSGEKQVLDSEHDLYRFAKRAIQASDEIKAGEVLDGKIALLRPGNNTKGMHPAFFDKVKRRQAARDIAAGEGIQRDMLC